ncbi:integrator complex subunit 14-like isoform X1 [Lethenteron reissneri]|uniref:integrator complex subunit 14-like isoform X1 n=1 Tax=Lethenteron reissneri TaxID=7753 RepID=UPI002AB77401|nr:integrator complex subunit 14-like isoform X1 [Lethenteron reissneri]XP_061414020.1 integrator complex subunit 14-like isoform X1 [Lethenteron reissneri]XP_061414021.1 integrator complex subunit 14-like isoform X1 [Lethenteron reissneri]XP_061414022.1 integrator complex subunit 14-like isoform X1 [Lethenteron reissneri]
MPTAILLDCSLSMACPVPGVAEGAEEPTRRQLATAALSALFQHVQALYRLEFTALLAFSSRWQLVVPFTRDYNALQEGLASLEERDKTCLEEALAGLSRVVLEEWGVGTPCQVIVVTDGCLGVGRGTLRHSLATLGARTDEEGRFPLPFPFPARLYVMCLATVDELQSIGALERLEKLIELNNGSGQIVAVEGQLLLKNVHNMVSKFTEQVYTPFPATLRCGHLASDVTLFPRPEPVTPEHEFDPHPKCISSALEIVGFLELADVSSPPVLSRHLVLPIAPAKESEEGVGGTPEEPEEESSAVTSAGKLPSFCVLLHGSLKVEGMVALVQLGTEWYGMLYSQADSKKKSNLMMSVFEPGCDPLPWLQAIPLLGPVTDYKENPYGADDSRSPFPLPPQCKRSYAQNLPVWIKPSGLQADIQKILRNARKLPEKTQTFYKELNRLRRAALAFGFWELLRGVADVLERECTLLPSSAHPDAAFQLAHAAQQMRLAARPDLHRATAYDCCVAPLPTNFSCAGVE